MEDLFESAGVDRKTAEPCQTDEYVEVMGGLTCPQREAVTHEGGPVIVLAGPGTGKTRVITARVAHMIRERGVEPGRIVAVTFTNKAAGELAQRLGTLVDASSAARVVASTFHSLGLGIIRRFGDVLGLPSDPLLIDSSQRTGLIRDIIREKGFYRQSLGRGIDAAVDHAHKAMEALRHQGIEAATARAKLGECGRKVEALEDAAERAAKREELGRFAHAVGVYEAFEAECRERGWLVFDDLIMLPTKLMREHPGIAGILRHDYQHVVVDEFQDVNAAQIGLIRQLCPPRSEPDLCVVGDDDQSIYGFRGADDRAFAHFAQIWKGVPTVELSTNFRSSDAVVRAGNEIIMRAHDRFAPEKRAKAHKGTVAGSALELVRLEDEAQGGEAIASMLLRLAGGGGEGFTLGSCAVIARTNPELERIARMLMLEGIPFEMRQRRAPMDDDGAQDVMAWVRLLADPDSVPDARRILCRPPYGLNPVKLGSVITGYRVAKSRKNAGDEEAQDPGALLDWIERHCDQEVRGRVASMRALAGDLTGVAAQSPAGEALVEIIKRTGVIHRELGDARARAARIEAVAAIVRFARSRAGRFEQPGDLAAMLRYWQDLDDTERALGELPEDRVVHSGGTDAGGADPGAVALLTAHASKGLEFDTVFIPRVSGPHGYPKTGGGVDEQMLPEGMIEELCPDKRDAKARQIDEERRVFYVALTRAERRAVLLAKVPKKPSSVNFACELRAGLGADLVERDASDVMDAGRAGDAVSRLSAEFKAVSRTRDVFEQARRDARRDAAEAIDALELGEIDRSGLRRRIGEASDRIAVVSAVLRDGVVPEWVEDAQLRRFAATLVEAIETRGAGNDGRIYPGLKSPLKLSYTHIFQYLHCPRCYLVEHVLKIPTQDALVAVLGKAVHRALERFYTAWREADSEGRATPGVDELDALVRAEFLRAWPRDVEVDERCLEQARAMVRVMWERLHSDAAHIEEVEKSLRLPYECDGVTHTITAVLDRIDATESGGRRVIDYKTGSARKDLAQPRSDDLQLGIYAMALEHELGDPGPGSVCEYWLLQDGARGSIGVDAIDMKKVRKKIDKAIRGMLEGDWERSYKCGDGSLCSILDQPGVKIGPEEAG